MPSSPTDRAAKPRKPREVRRFEAPRGWLEVGILAPGIVYQRGEGHAMAQVAEQLCARLEELVARFGKVELFDDWFGITGYDSDARRIVERWTSERRDSLVRIHVLTSSKLVSMALSVSNLVTGGVTTAYSLPSEFDVALDAALARR